MKNPIIRHKYTADPTVIVHNDTVYLYTGHDEAPLNVENYVMKEWLCFSSGDMVNWKEHPVPLKGTGFSWAKGDALASKVIRRDHRFYWYVAVTHGDASGKAIGVAVSDSPAGPFSDARGSALITPDMLPPAHTGSDNYDPAVLIDDDGQAYIFWGKYQCYYAKLKENMTELEGPVRPVSLPDFEEGAHIHKQDGWYYLSYGYGFPEKVGYATSRSIHGPWEFKGILNEIAGNSQTNRPAIIDFKGRSYFFYHNGGLENGGSHRRSVCVDYLYYNPDGTMKRVMMTSEGVQPAGAKIKTRTGELSVEFARHYRDEFPRIYKGEPWLGPSMLKILKGISAAQAFKRPLEQAHSIAELLTHMVSWRQDVINRMERSGKPKPKQQETFEPGRFGSSEKEIWENLLNQLEVQNRQFTALLEGLVKDPAKAGRVSFRPIGGIIQHDIYHMGQIAVLKKSATQY